MKSNTNKLIQINSIVSRFKLFLCSKNQLYIRVTSAIIFSKKLGIDPEASLY